MFDLKSFLVVLISVALGVGGLWYVLAQEPDPLTVAEFEARNFASSEGEELLTLITELNNIDLTVDFLDSDTYKSLVDSSEELPEFDAGRDNPFEEAN